MDKNNPACRECPKGKNKLHTWRVERDDHRRIISATCARCKLHLGVDWARDMVREL